MQQDADAIFIPLCGSHNAKVIVRKWIATPLLP